MKKPVNYSRLFSAVRFWISLFALAGFYQFLRWLRTSGTGKDIAAFVGGAVSMGLLIAFLIHVAETLLRQHRITKQFKAARAQRTQDETPPEEFFAAHRQTLETVNELILADAEQDRPWAFSYDWDSSGQGLCMDAYQHWTVALTEEQKQLFESNYHFLDIALTPDTITYNIDNVRSLIYVIEYSKSFEHLQHLDGKWYYTDKNRRDSL